MKRLVNSTGLLLGIVISSHGQLIPNEPKNVAIFLYEDVELLDFAGPGEVFSASGFNTYTVSVDGKELTSQRFVKIKPDYSIKDVPSPDIIVFPGGNSSPSANDTVVINWIKNTKAKGTNFMSVCTGAFIIAKAGLLENKRVTTHWGSTRSLAQQYPATTVMENTRWVDNGFVITTAGVSAGIDGALHFVARIKGRDAAQRTAHYMEYDKWNPDNGVVAVKNTSIDFFLSDRHEPEKKILKAPFPGEYIDFSRMLIAKGDVVNAKRVVEEGVKLYPQSSDLFKVLRVVKLKNSEPVPLDESELVGMIREGKVNEALTQYQKDKKTFPHWRIFDENTMNDAGYFLLHEKKDVAGAIKVFELNAREFPKSPNTFDSLAEAQLIAGNRAEGIKNYQKAAAMGLENSKTMLKELEGK